MAHDHPPCTPPPPECGEPPPADGCGGRSGIDQGQPVHSAADQARPEKRATARNRSTGTELAVRFTRRRIVSTGHARGVDAMTVPLASLVQAVEQGSWYGKPGTYCARSSRVMASPSVAHIWAATCSVSVSHSQAVLSLPPAARVCPSGL